jgi:N-acetylmuramoyl-L-alanine amidase
MPSTAIASDPSSVPEVVFVKANSVNVREAAGASAKVVATVRKGGKLLVLEESQNGSEKWYRVKLEDQREGWVASWLVSLQP